VDNPAATEGLLGAADIQSLADLGNSYSVVGEMRTVPFGLQDISRLAIATAAPMVPLLLTIWPPEELIMRIVKVVFLMILDSQRVEPEELWTNETSSINTANELAERSSSFPVRFGNIFHIAVPRDSNPRFCNLELRATAAKAGLDLPSHHFLSHHQTI